MGFTTSLISLATFLLFGLFIFYTIDRLANHNRWLKRHTRGLSLVSVMLLTAAVMAPMFYNQLGKLGILIGFLGVACVLFILLGRMPGSSMSFADRQDKFLLSLVGERTGNSRVLRMSLLLTGSILFLNPMINYVVKYDEVALRGSHMAHMAHLRDKEYMVSRIYSDKYILTEYQSGRLVPNYVILRASETLSLEIQTREILADNTSLHPFSQKTQKFLLELKHLLGISR